MCIVADTQRRQCSSRVDWQYPVLVGATLLCTTAAGLAYPEYLQQLQCSLTYSADSQQPASLPAIFPTD